MNDLTLNNQLFPALHQTIQQLLQQFSHISSERKAILKDLADFISLKLKAGESAKLNFICTHNSRRSHLAQIWAQTAAHYYGIEKVDTYSGGTEATAFNPRAVQAMGRAGFEITSADKGSNPGYDVRYAEGKPPLRVFSKKYNDNTNPEKDFAAVMTCSHADENCPLIIGASTRIALTYDDPKDFDGTPHEAARYTERVHEIGRDLLYAFSLVK